MRRTRSYRRLPERQAALFVDYQNVYTLINDRLDRGEHPDELIAEVIDELRRRLFEDERARVTIAQAYADFGTFEDEDGSFLQRSLTFQGVEPRYVPLPLQENAAEVQLTIDVIEVAHARPDIDTFVIVAGDRTYLSLAQHLRRTGRDVLVVALETPSRSDRLPAGLEDIILNMGGLMSDRSRRYLREAQPGDGADEAVEAKPAAPARPIEDPAALEALDVIEEHFGQYEEVYLTPLLRKLSEVFDESQHDPKSLVSTLERHGAVRLEKRRGFPYDYTVLLVEPDHPDVQAAARAFEQGADADDAEDFDGEDDYAYDGNYDEAYDPEAYDAEES